jgi:hypothetical protein
MEHAHQYQYCGYTVRITVTSNSLVIVGLELQGIAILLGCLSAYSIWRTLKDRSLANQASVSERLASLSAVARRIAKRKNRVSSTGPGSDRSRVSPPGSSSTSVGHPDCSRRSMGRTAQAESKSSLNEYSCFNFCMTSTAGRFEAGTRRRTIGESGWFGCSPRERTNSSSLQSVPN